MGREETFQGKLMIIKSIQKQTFIDYPGKSACTLFISGCNFRCGFCHNPELTYVGDKGISEEYVLRFLKKRRKYLDGVCITGGEPLLTLDAEFVKKVKDMGYCIKLDTNGSMPKRLKWFIKNGLLDYVAMDIKSSKENYNMITGSKVNINLIEESIALISQLPSYEFRTTVIPSFHNIKEIVKIKDWLLKASGKKKLISFYLQAFNARPGQMNDKRFDKVQPPSSELLNKMKDRIKNSFETCEIRD